MDTSVQDRLTSLLRFTFETDDLTADPQVTFDAITGADSLGRVRLFLEVEETFDVRFSTAETASLANIGQLVELIESKQVARR